MTALMQSLCRITLTFLLIQVTSRICKENGKYEDFTCDADLDEIVMVDLRTEKISCGKV